MSNRSEQNNEASEDQQTIPDAFYPPSGTVCTEAFSRFLTEYHANLDYFFFVVRLVARADEQRVIAAKALLKVGTNTEEEKERLEKSASDEEIVLRQLQKHARVLAQNLTNGAVSAFQRYFSGIINSAARKKPALLSSAQTIRVDDVLRFTKHRELVAFVIDRKVNDLSYGGLEDMERYFDERLGVRMFEDDRQRDLLKLFVEVRNINVHNGGIVNDVFASRVGAVDGYPYSRGKRFHVDMDRLVTLSSNAMQVAMNIDSVVRAKFGLKRQKHSVWKKAANSESSR